MTTQIACTQTSKGHRVWLQGVAQRGYAGRYSVEYTQDAVLVRFHDEGKRTLCAAKGGIIDIQSKRLTAWAQGAQTVHVQHADSTITITRGA